MMPLLIPAARRASRKVEHLPPTGWLDHAEAFEAEQDSNVGARTGFATPCGAWRNRGRSEWGCMVVEMSDMHCSAGS